MCFGGDTVINQPSPPQPPSAVQSAADWAAALPSVYQTQLQYEPQLMAQQLAMQEQYGTKMLDQYMKAQTEYAPQMLEQDYQAQLKYAPLLARSQYDITNQMYPQTAALQESLAQKATQGMDSAIPASQRAAYLDQLRAEVGPNAGSGIAGDYVSRNLMNQQEDYNRYYQNLGLSVTGRQPLTQPSAVQNPTVNVPQYGGSQWTSGFTPNSVMGANQQGYGSYAGLYGSMYNANANAAAAQNQGMFGLMGAGLSTAGLMYAAPFMGRR